MTLNNLIQDTTYMKDYLSYTMMKAMGVYSPLCSCANISVNGNTWALYLAGEGIEEAFAQRNFGTDYDKLYKPNHMSIGRAKRNRNEEHTQPPDIPNTENRIPFTPERQDATADTPPDTGNMSGTLEQQAETNDFLAAQVPTADDAPDAKNATATEQELSDTQIEESMQKQRGGLGGSDRNAQDVALQYIDDNSESYANIFDYIVFDISNKNKKRLIRALEQLNAGDVSGSVNIDEVLRYFVVHNFTNIFDSYTGNMGHNYYLYEENGILSMIPWDYNLAFGAFGNMCGAPDRGQASAQETDSAAESINYPINTPASGISMGTRPPLY